MTALTLLLYVPDSLSYVLYPQLLKRYQLGGSQPEAIRGQVKRIFRAQSVLVPAMCGLAFLLSRDLLSALLPKFLPGLSAVRLICFGAGGLAFVGISAIVLMTLGNQRFLVPAVLIGSLLGAALDLVAVKLGFGITGVGFATMIAYVLNGAVMAAIAHAGLDQSWRRTGQHVLRDFLPLAIAFGIAFAVDRLLPWPIQAPWLPRVLHALAESLLFLGLYALFVSPLARGAGLRRLLTQLKPGAAGRAEDAER